VQSPFAPSRGVEIFGFDDVETGIVELLEKLDDNEYTNLK